MPEDLDISDAADVVTPDPGSPSEAGSIPSMGSAEFSPLEGSVADTAEDMTDAAGNLVDADI